MDFFKPVKTLSLLATLLSSTPLHAVTVQEALEGGAIEGERYMSVSYDTHLAYRPGVPQAVSSVKGAMLHFEHCIGWGDPEKVKDAFQQGMRWLSLYVGSPETASFGLSFKSCALGNLLPLDSLPVASVTIVDGFLGDDVCASLPTTFSLTAEDLGQARETGLTIQEMALGKGLPRTPLPEVFVTVEEALGQIEALGSSPHLKMEQGILPSGKSYALLKFLKCKGWGFSEGVVQKIFSSLAVDRGAIASAQVSFRECEFDELEPVYEVLPSSIRAENLVLRNPLEGFPRRFFLDFYTLDSVIGVQGITAEIEEETAVAGGAAEDRLSDSDSLVVLQKMPSLSQRISAHIFSADLLERGGSSNNIFRL
jgi:hypothetical protein